MQLYSSYIGCSLEIGQVLIGTQALSINSIFLGFINLIRNHAAMSDGVWDFKQPQKGTEGQGPAWSDHSPKNLP